MRDLVLFVQLKKRETHPWRSVTFSKVAGFTKSNTPPWVFFTFLKLYEWHQIAQSTTYFKKGVRDRHDLLYEDKHQSFLQGSSAIFTGHS